MIRYRYPDESWQEIDGDEYTLEQEKGECPVLYHAFGTFFSKNHSAGGCDKNAWWRTKVSLNGSVVKSWQPIVNSSNYWTIELNNGTFQDLTTIPQSQYDSNYLTNSSFGGIVYKTDGGRFCTNRSRPGDGTGVVLTKLIRIDGQSDNCGDYIFTVTKNGQVVYQETREEIPEVEILGDGCPPDTCEVTCGDTICCYNSEGISVHDFPRP